MSDLGQLFGSFETPRAYCAAFLDTGVYPLYYWQVWDFGARVNCAPVVGDDALIRQAMVNLSPPKGFASLREDLAGRAWNAMDLATALIAAKNWVTDGLAFRPNASFKPDLQAPLVEAFFAQFSQRACCYSNFSPVSGVNIGTGWSPISNATFNNVFAVVDRNGGASGGTLVGLLSIEDED